MRKQVATSFRQLIECVEDTDIVGELILPLSHIPDSDNLDDIVDNGVLKCFKGNRPYEDEELAFFSYGRNAFISGKKKNLEFDAYPPLVFLLHPYKVHKVGKTPKRMLPFDSGAYDKYDKPEEMSIKKFEIDAPGCEDYLKLVFLLYKGYKKYLDDKHDFEDLVHEFNLFSALRALHKIYSSQTTEDSVIGMQGRSLEIHYSEDVPLDPLLILYPHIWGGKKYNPSQLKMKFPNSHLRMYTNRTSGGGGGPKSYRGFINDAIRKFINENKELFKWPTED